MSTKQHIFFSDDSCWGMILYEIINYIKKIINQELKINPIHAWQVDIFAILMKFPFLFLIMLAILDRLQNCGIYLWERTTHRNS
jgi:hypothetical protein